MDKAGRGWNDPPSIPVVVPVTSTSAKRSGINLNKRIAFPLSGPSLPAATNDDGSKPHTGLPQMPPANVLPPSTGLPPRMPPAADQGPVLGSDDGAVASLEEMTENLDKILADVEGLEHRSDVLRRLEEMKRMWQEGLLDHHLCRKLLQISQALLSKDTSLASSLQLEVSSGWPADSIKWAAAIRCLVNHLRLSSEPSSEHNSSGGIEQN